MVTIVCYESKQTLLVYRGLFLENILSTGLHRWYSVLFKRHFDIMKSWNPGEARVPREAEAEQVDSVNKPYTVVEQ